MKTLHVHIGTPKTATTAIQHFCKENAKILAEKGFCYPIFPFRYPENSDAHNGRFLWAKLFDENGVRDRKQEEINFRKGMEIVKRLFETYNDIIVSDESIWRAMDSEKKDFWNVLEQEAKENGFSLHAIVYLRRQDKYYLSHWNQQVKKHRLEEPFDVYIGKRTGRLRLDYYWKLERMASVIGKECITVRRYDRETFQGGSIYSDFLSVFGLELTEEYTMAQEIRNIGLYGNTHEIKRILNSLSLMQDEKQQKYFLKLLQECSEISKKRYPCAMMSKDEISKFLEAHRAGNEKIAEEYLHETGTELFDYAIEDMPKWEKTNPYMLDDLICFIGVAVAMLHKENEDLKNAWKKTFFGKLRHRFGMILCRLGEIKLQE